MAIHVHPGHAVGQLGGLVEHYDIVVQGQVQLWEVVFVLWRLAEGQLACKKRLHIRHLDLQLQQCMLLVKLLQASPASSRLLNNDALRRFQKQV